MKELLIKEGIHTNSIILEEEALNTAENAYYCVPILIKNNIKDITLITSDFHMARSSYLFEAVFQHRGKESGIVINNRISV